MDFIDDNIFNGFRFHVLRFVLFMKGLTDGSGIVRGMARGRGVRGDAQAPFKDAHGDFLRFHNITLFHGHFVGWPSFDPLPFRFRKTVAREKVVHFSDGGHSMLWFSFLVSILQLTLPVRITPRHRRARLSAI